jgi:hypothetical protein
LIPREKLFWYGNVAVVSNLEGKNKKFKFCMVPERGMVWIVPNLPGTSRFQNEKKCICNFDLHIAKAYSQQSEVPLLERLINVKELWSWNTYMVYLYLSALTIAACHHAGCYSFAGLVTKQNPCFSLEIVYDIHTVDGPFVSPVPRSQTSCRTEIQEEQTHKGSMTCNIVIL